MLTRRGFLRRIDVPRVEDAIRRAEAATSGEIRVSVAGLFRGSPRRFAERAFLRLGMDRTRHRNAVLIAISPARRSLRIVADAGIHAHAGDAAWSRIATALQRRMAAGEFTDGLVEAIGAVGTELAARFPPDAGAPADELPNAVDAGGG